jgi:hypothetical protein
MTNKKQQKIDFLSLDNDSKVEHNKWLNEEYFLLGKKFNKISQGASNKRWKTK